MLPPVFNKVVKKRKGIRLAIREDAYMGAKESMIYYPKAHG